MAFVADFNEDELQRALAAAGGAPTLSEGPIGAAAGSGGTTAPAIPASGGPPAAGGAQGTGFVNLSRYFDANKDAAQKSAEAIINPLKQDLTPIGDAAANAVPLPSAPTGELPPRDNSRNKQDGQADRRSPGTPTPPRVPVVGAGAQTAYDQALAQAQSQQSIDRAKAMQDAQLSNVSKGRSYLEDPNRLREAMSTGGRDPAALDAYLTGAAAPSAYQGLFDYYGGSAAAHDNPYGANSPLGGRPVENPNYSPAPPARPAPPPAGPVPGTTTAADALTQFMKKSKPNPNRGGHR